MRSSALLGFCALVSACCNMSSAPPCDPAAPDIWCDACSPDHSLCRGAGGIGGNCAHLTEGAAVQRYCDVAHPNEGVASSPARTECMLTGRARGELTLACRPWTDPSRPPPSTP